MMWLNAVRVGKGKPPGTTDRRNILMKFYRHDLKNELIMEAGNKKPDNFYLNDNLTQSRSSILFALRRARRRHKQIVTACGSLDNRVFVWIKPSSGSDNSIKLFVNTHTRLEEICTKHLGITYDSN